jgi:hypothetical protein
MFRPREDTIMTRLPCLVVAAGLLGLGAVPAAAADDCATALPELQQATQRPEVDEITREKISSLLSDAKQLCADGDQAEAGAKFANVRELLEGDREEPANGASD